MKKIKKSKEKKDRKPKKLSVAVTEDELIGVLDNLEQMHHKLAVIMAWGAGCRLSEVLSLEPRHFNFKTSELFIQQGKNSKDRITVIPPCIGQEHLKYFPIPCGKRSLQKAFEDSCIKSGLMKTKPTVHFHSLRHGFATRWVNQGLNLQQLQGMLGHEDIGTTSIYTHMAKEDGIKSYKEGF